MLAVSRGARQATGDNYQEIEAVLSESNFALIAIRGSTAQESNWSKSAPNPRQKCHKRTLLVDLGLCEDGL
jgi:hypothetical protein